MATKKKSRRLGILTEKETQFLFMTEEERKRRYKAGTRKYYERIVESANRGFQDYSIMIIHLPKRYRDKIEFVSGLRHIESSLSKVGDTEQIPHRIIETTLTNLENCLKIIGKQYNHKLKEIAKADFDNVEQWLTMAQKYPEPQGASF